MQRSLNVNDKQQQQQRTKKGNYRTAALILIVYLQCIQYKRTHTHTLFILRRSLLNCDTIHETYCSPLSENELDPGTINVEYITIYPSNMMKRKL